METKIVDLLSDNTALPVLFIGSGLSRRYLNLPDWEGLLKQYCVKPFEYYNDKATRACRDNPEMRLPTAADYIEEDFNERWYAIFIGFTGTPLLKKDKKTSLEIFGGYIHTYKFNEGVRDGVVLDLRYEARDVPQGMTSQDRIDAWFEAKTVGLAPRAKAKLKAYWGNLQKIFSSRSRLEQIANDIIFDFATKARLMDGNGNAILVAGSVYSACRYYEIFQSKGFRKCASRVRFC